MHERIVDEPVSAAEKHDGQIGRIGERERRRKAQDQGGPDPVAVAECPVPVQEETEGEAGGIAQSIRRVIAKARQKGEHDDRIPERGVGETGDREAQQPARLIPPGE